MFRMAFDESCWRNHPGWRRSSDGTSMSNDDNDLPSVKRLLLLSVPSVLNEAAPFASALCQTALLSHAGEAFRRAGRSYSSEEAVAAFGAVTQTTNFVTGLFNFLLMFQLLNLCLCSPPHLPHRKMRC